jgi:hypothetical protein
MKCCMGKAGAAGSSGISCELGETKIEKVDAMFNEAKAVLELCEGLRSGLEDAKSSMMAVSGAYTLKEGNMTDAVTLFFWGLGADMGVDKLAEMKPKISMEKPYLEMPELDATVGDEAKEFMEAFKLWCTTVAESPNTVTELTTKLTDAITKAKECAGTIQTDATESGLSAMDKVKAAKTVASNTAAMGKASAKLTELGAAATTAVTDMKALAEGLAGILGDASKNVTEGKEKGAKSMADFADKQHSKENLAAADQAKNADKTAYDAMKKAGKGASAAKPAEAKAEEAAPAAAEEAAPAAEAAADEAKPEDVKPEVRDV